VLVSRFVAVLLLLAWPAMAHASPADEATRVCATRTEPREPCIRRLVADQAESEALLAEAQKYTPDWFESATEEQLAHAVPDALRTLARLNGISIDLGHPPPPDLAARVAAAKGELQGMVDKERACRVDARCTAARAAKRAEAEFVSSTVDPMCELDQRREQAIAYMAHEQANPSGYVDRVLLHQLGADIQSYREQLASYMPQFLKVRHRAWRGWRAECPQNVP
jgi:hypothetical protein